MITRQNFVVRNAYPVFFLIFLAGIVPILAQSTHTRTKPFSPSQIAQKVIPSVVVVTVKDSSGNVRLGSGFFIEPDLVATNYHLVKGAIVSDVSVRLIRSRSTGEPHFLKEAEGTQISNVIGVDKDRDLALLWIKRARETPLKLARRKHAIGDTIYVVGNPKGFEGTFSQGVISGFRSSGLVQISAPISPGSSGGPVLDNTGEVIGIVIGAIPDAQNLNFARSSEVLLAFQKNAYLDFPRQKWLDFSGIDLSVFRDEQSPEKQESSIPPVRSGIGSPPVPQPRPEWSPVSLTDDTIYLMNMNELITDEGITRVWVKEVLFNNKDKKAATINLADYAHSPYKLVLYQCDCKRKLMMVAMFVDYDGNGNVKKSGDLRNAGIATWSEVVPDSIGGSIFKSACSH